MKIVDIDVQHLDFVARCGYTENSWNRPLEIAEIAKQWLRKKVAQGMIIKVAVNDSGEPAAFIRALPADISPFYITGKNLAAVTCIMADTDMARKSGKGIGSLLLKELETEARKNFMGVCVIAYDMEYPFMPHGFFKKNGYLEVSRQNEKVLMLKEFEPVSAPAFINLSFAPQLVPGKVVVDIFFNPLCMTSITELFTVRRACSHFSDQVILNEYCTGDSGVCHSCGTVRDLFVNGKPLNFGYDAPYDSVVKEIKEAVSNL